MLVYKGYKPLLPKKSNKVKQNNTNKCERTEGG